MSANTVRDFSDIGIRVGRGATAEIAGNEVIGGQWGIAANNEATTATIRQNTVSGTQYQSIGVVDGASATVEGNTVSGGTSGIYVRNTGSRAVITGNSVSAEDEGIYVWEGATAERITNNTVTGGSSGIVIEGEGAGTTMVVEANRVSDVSHEGIAVRDGAGVEISRNDLTDVGFGIQFSQGAHGTVDGNMLSGVTNTGIRLIDPAPARP